MPRKPAARPEPLFDQPEAERKLRDMLLAMARLPEEERTAQLLALREALTDDQIREILAWHQRFKDGEGLVIDARVYDLQGYNAFYKLMHGFFPPAHVQAEVRAILESSARDKGVEILASRGSWKTTSIALTFVPFFIGHHPTTATLVIQANDASASGTALAIAETIKMHPAFTSVFPHVVPYPERKWSEEGYEVRITHTDCNLQQEVSLAEWAKMTGARKDPSLLALSYSSKSVVGKHPTGLFLIDDIHDEENTKSPAMLEDVLNKLRGTILPMVFSLRDESAPVGQQLVTTIAAIGTPWVEGDAMQYLRETGEFEVFEFPVVQEVSENTENAVRLDHVSPRGEELKGWFLFNWPEKFGYNATLAAFNTSGKYDFWRMYLLKFIAKAGEGVRFILFPAQQIDVTNDVAGGCDYASMMAERKRDPKDRSRFAHVYVVKIPNLNKLVVQECFSEHVTQVEAERQLRRAQNLFKHWRGTWLEMEGVGGEAMQTFQRDPSLNLIPSYTKGVPKHRRHELFVNPWLEIGQVMISDANTPGLNRLRAALAKWPNGSTDEMDALFHALKAFPEVLRLEDNQEGARPRTYKQKRSYNAFTSAFGGGRV